MTATNTGAEPGAPPPHAAPPAGRRAWIYLCVSVCVLALTAGVAYGVAVGQTNQAELDRSAMEAIVYLAQASTDQRLHHQAASEFAPFLSAYTDEERWRAHAFTRFKLSRDRQAYLAVARPPRDPGVECAHVETSGSSPVTQSRIRTGGWRLRPGEGIKCRRAGALWPLLHLANLSAVSTDGGFAALRDGLPYLAE